MNLLKKEVIHKSLGAGHVIAFDGKTITIQFDQRSVKFSFPSVFNELLRMKDLNLQHDINELCVNEDYLINRQREERMAEFESRFAYVPDNKPTAKQRASQLRDKSNIAIRCNYNDGGRTETLFGYKGICSEAVLHQNVVVSRRPWCSAATCECKRYTGGKITREELEKKYADGTFICHESKLLRDWIASAGRLQSEKRTDNKPIKMTNARVNRLCVLTTKLPNELEADRKVFAAFIISEVEVGDEKVEGNVHAHPRFRIDLSPEEAEHVHFWDFHKNKSKPEVPYWGSGFLRYLTDAQSINMIKAMMEATQDANKKARILEMLEYYCRVTAAASK